MSGDHRQRAERFARLLMFRATWMAGLVAAGFIAAPLAAMIGPNASGNVFAVLTALVAAGAGLACLALSGLALFDAVLFRVIASHESGDVGCKAVDDILARMRLKPNPGLTRPLDERIAGTRQLLVQQAIAAGLFAAAWMTSMLVAVSA